MGIWKRMTATAAVGIASVAILFAGPVPVSAGDSQKLAFDRINELPEKYLLALRQMHELDLELDKELARPMENVFRVALVDLNDDGEDEMAIEIGHALYGQMPLVHVVFAHLTPGGWRFIGAMEVPDRGQITEPEAYIERASHKGWRILNKPKVVQH